MVDYITENNCIFGGLMLTCFSLGLPLINLNAAIKIHMPLHMHADLILGCCTTGANSVFPT
jgi:hypothetical protein